MNEISSYRYGYPKLANKAVEYETDKSQMGLCCQRYDRQNRKLVLDGYRLRDVYV